MIVQIYEVTTPAEARALGTLGIDHVGVDSKTKTDKNDGSHYKRFAEGVGVREGSP